MPNKRTNFQEIVENLAANKPVFLSEIQYYKVSSVAGDKVAVINERGFAFEASSGIVEEGMYSANQYKETIEVTRTRLIEIFTAVQDTLFTVCYHVQPKADEVNEAIESANKGKIMAIKDLKKLIKEAYKGRERILIGYMIKVETGFGRSLVIDLEQDKGDNPDWDARTRQVDHRTLNWLIYQNVMYKVKK